MSKNRTTRVLLKDKSPSGSAAAKGHAFRLSGTKTGIIFSPTLKQSETKTDHRDPTLSKQDQPQNPVRQVWETRAILNCILHERHGKSVVRKKESERKLAPRKHKLDTPKKLMAPEKKIGPHTLISLHRKGTLGIRKESSCSSNELRGSFKLHSRYRQHRYLRSDHANKSENRVIVGTTRSWSACFPFL